MIRRLSLLVFGWCFCTTLIHCEKTDFDLSLYILDEKKCYLVFRGTDTKEGVVAKEYNILNKKSSHVGICVFQKSKWTVYHVLSPKKKDDTALIKEGLDEFFDVSKEPIHSASIWVLNELKDSEISKLKTQLNKYEKVKLKFDLSFSSRDTTNLYCSKFVNDVLENVNSEKFIFQTSKVKLKPLHSVFVGQDSLDYYPVDVFQTKEDIVLVKEWNLKR